MPRIATRKAQVVLTEDQYRMLQTRAVSEGISVSELVRSSLERTLLADLEREQRRAALNELFSLNLPIADWPDIEHDLATRYDGCSTAEPV